LKLFLVVKALVLYKEKELSNSEGEAFFLTLTLMMMVDPNSRARKEEEGKKKRRRSMEEDERNADYGGMVQPSQQHVAPCVIVLCKEKSHRIGT